MSYRAWRNSANFTRPNDTTAYADEDLVANSTTAGSVVPLGFGIGGNSRIHGVQLQKSSATVTLANFTLYLYGDSPTVTNGDNGAFSSTASDFLNGIALSMATPAAGTPTTSDDGIVTAWFSTPILWSGEGRVFGLLKAEAAYVPAAQEVFTVTLFGDTPY